MAILEVAAALGGALTGAIQFVAAEHFRFKQAVLARDIAKDEHGHVERLHKLKNLQMQQQNQWTGEQKAEDRDLIEYQLDSMLDAQGDLARLEHDTAMLDDLEKGSWVLRLAGSVRPVLAYVMTLGTGVVLALLMFNDAVATQYVSSGELGTYTLMAWLTVWGNATSFYFTQRYALKFHGHA